MGAELILYLLTLLTTGSIGMVRLKSLTVPLRAVVWMVTVTAMNECVIHFGLLPGKWLNLDYQIYAYVSFALYYVFTTTALRPGINRSLAVFVGAVALVVTLVLQLNQTGSDFPSASIVINSTALIIQCFLFISYRMKQPSDMKLGRDSHFLLVLLTLSYWSVFIAKHAFQSQLIKQNVQLTLVELSFTWFSIAYYCGMGMIFYRHRSHHGATNTY